MALQALLLTHDSEVQRVLQQALDSANIDLELCFSAEHARQILSRQKFDALLVDCDDMKGGTDVLRDLRKARSNRNCVAFALINRITTVEQAFELGANFVLNKPVSLERAMRSVRAAQGLIMRERRRYHRHLLNAKGVIVVDAGTELPVSITNISQGGISIECARELDEGGAARLKFNLPGSKKTIEIKGEVVWASPEGQAGIRFQVLPLESKKELDSWLERRTVPMEGAMFIDATMQA